MSRPFDNLMLIALRASRPIRAYAGTPNAVAARGWSLWNISPCNTAVTPRESG